LRPQKRHKTSSLKLANAVRKIAIAKTVIANAAKLKKTTEKNKKGGKTTWQAIDISAE
jgi:hypothetical protein